MTLVRRVMPADRDAWGVLWQGYQAFYKVAIPDGVTELTWQRFFDGIEPVNALVAVQGDRLVGMAHYIFHRNTWMAGPVCYLQDLFTAEAVRGGGVGRRLIEAVYDAAKAAGTQRVYWMTHESNAEAMRLYDKVAVKSGFLQYRKEL